MLTAMPFCLFVCLCPYMSRGYTSAFARTAPVEPATARPQGGSAAAFDCAVMVYGVR